MQLPKIKYENNWLEILEGEFTGTKFQYLDLLTTDDGIQFNLITEPEDDLTPDFIELAKLILEQAIYRAVDYDNNTNAS